SRRRLYRPRVLSLSRRPKTAPVSSKPYYVTIVLKLKDLPELKILSSVSPLLSVLVARLLQRQAIPSQMARLGLVWDTKTHCGLYLVHGWLAFGRFYHILIYQNTIVVDFTTEQKKDQLEHTLRR